MPPPGMWMSSRQTSGSASSASATAAVASPDSPHTSKPADSSSRRTASRISGWSSAIRTLAVSREVAVPVSPFRFTGS